MKTLFLFSVLLLLICSNVFSQTNVPDSTNISGNWTLANSPYIIQGRAIVPNGQTLTIEPGVEVRLKSSASVSPSWFDYSAGNVGVIRVVGNIIANGTTDDPIVFTRNDNGFWGTILIDENASGGSSFSNCVIEYAKESRNVPGISTPVSFNGGISVYKSDISIHRNIFKNNNINGLYIKEVTNSFDFSENTFHDNGTNGSVIEQSVVNAINNTFYSNSISATGQVSAIRSSNSTVYLVGNLIYDNDDWGIYAINGGDHYIINNTIFGNSEGIRVENGANTYIYNSIIQDNTLNFATSNVGGANIEMQYSLTNDNTLPANITNVANNLLGSDAQFTNPGSSDFSLQSGSPAIDAGNPSTTGLNIPQTDILGNVRIDNGVIDIGSIEFQHPITDFTVTTSSSPTAGGSTNGGGTYASGSNVTVTATPNQGYSFVNWTENGTVVSSSPDYSFTLSSDRNLVANFELTVSIDEEKNEEKTISTYPNPTDGIVNIIARNLSKVEVYTFSGKFIFSTEQSVVDIRTQPAGIYLLKIKSSSGTETTKRVMKR